MGYTHYTRMSNQRWCAKIGRIHWFILDFRSLMTYSVLPFHVYCSKLDHSVFFSGNTKSNIESNKTHYYSNNATFPYQICSNWGWCLTKTERMDIYISLCVDVFVCALFSIWKLPNIFTKLRFCWETPLMGFMPSLLLPDFSQFPIAAFRILTLGCAILIPQIVSCVCVCILYTRFTLQWNR